MSAPRRLLPHPCPRPRHRAFALGLALLLGFGAGGARQAHAAPGSYEIVDLSGKTFATLGLVFTSDGVKASTPAGLQEIPNTSIDWYETFYRNIRSGQTNVVAFQPGSLLRFDRFELKDGQVILTVAGGGEIQLAESLIDFERSVREGAMVKLPEGAGASVQVSRAAGGGAWTDDSGGEATTSASRRSARSMSRRRPGGALAPPPVAPEDGTTEPPPEMMSEEQPPMDRPEDIQPEEQPQEEDRFGRSSPFPRRGGLSEPKDNPGQNQNQGQNQGEGQESGQAVVTISTDYSGPVGGLQVLLQFPPNLQVVEPVAFTGFAGNWMATPNTTVAGQINIAGVAQPGTTVSGGEFLRVTFVWTGTPPARQLFRISQLRATGENSETLTDFRTTMDVQVSP